MSETKDKQRLNLKQSSGIMVEQGFSTSAGRGSQNTHKSLRTQRTVIFTLHLLKIYQANITLSVSDIYGKPTLGPDPKVEKLWAKTSQTAAL